MTQKYRQISCISIGVDTLGLIGLSVTILLHERIRSINLKEHFVHRFSFLKVLNSIKDFAFWCNLFFFIIFIITFTVTLVVGCERSIAVGTSLLPAAVQGGRAGQASRLCATSQALAGEEDFGSWFSSWSLLCFILMCCLSPFSETLV